MSVRASIAAAMAVLSALIVCAAPAGADPADNEFYSLLHYHGFTVTNPALAKQQAQMICDEGLAHGVTWQEMRGQLMNSGYQSNDVAILGVAAITAYCPQYSTVADNIANGSI